MNDAVELLAFAGVMALGQFSPGPDMLLLTRTSLAEGARAGVAMAVGIGTGLTLHAALAIGGTAALFEQGGWIRGVLRWVAAVYLVWIALQIVRSARAMHLYGSGQPEEDPPRRPDRRSAFVRGLLCNLLNPKVMLFLAAVVAPFMRGERPGWWPWALWGVVVVQGATLWSGWALLLQWRPVRLTYGKLGYHLDLAFALLLVVLAVRVVWG